MDAAGTFPLVHRPTRLHPRTMAAVNTLGHDEMDRLTQHWRSQPDQLRQAVAASRTQYQATPKLPSGFRARDYLLGESRRGTALVGVVLTGAGTAAECQLEVEQAAAFVADNANAFPLGGSRKKPRPGVRVEVFLPPDAYLERPSSIRGIPLRWFRWTPIDEEQVSVEESATTDASPTAAPSSTVVVKLLAHLAWWTDAIATGSAAETPYRKALLVYNVAALLDWHTAESGSLTGQQSPDSRSRNAIGKAVREFTDVVHAVVTRIEGVAGSKADKQLGKLVSASRKLCKRLSKHYPLTGRLERTPDFEKPIRPYELLRTWLAANGAAGAERPPHAGRQALVPPPEDLVLQALVPVLAANALRDEGKLTPEACSVVRQVCAESVETALDVAARSTKGGDRKRWRRIGKPVVDALRRPATTRSSEAGS